MFELCLTVRILLKCIKKTEVTKSNTFIKKSGSGLKEDNLAYKF